MAMARMTFTVPEELKRRLQARRDVNWSGMVARALEERLEALELADEIVSRSRATEEDVKELSHIIKKAVGEAARREIEELRKRRSESSSMQTD